MVAAAKNMSRIPTSCEIVNKTQSRALMLHNCCIIVFHSPRYVLLRVLFDGDICELKCITRASYKDKLIYIEICDDYSVLHAEKRGTQREAVEW
jgi:hypothetical protein